MVAPSTALGVCRDVVAAVDQAGLVLVDILFVDIIDNQETPMYSQMS
jgi:hypothetical protein